MTEQNKEKKRKIRKWFLIIGIPLVLLLYLFAETLLFTGGNLIHETKIDIYASKFCPNAEYYDFDVDLTVEESRALGLYYLISDEIVEENQLSSFLECCEHLNMNCEENIHRYSENQTSQVVVVVFESGELKVFDFEASKEEVIDKFFNYKISREVK